MKTLILTILIALLMIGIYYLFPGTSYITERGCITGKTWMTFMFKTICP